MAVVARIIGAATVRGTRPTKPGKRFGNVATN
jgi:hypothetical protein